MRIWIVTLFIIILSTATFGQTPEGFTYQAVARDAAGEILANQTVGMQISILQGSVSGTTVFTETHTASSNSFGLINLVIGQGMTSHSFSTIDWAGGPYFIKIEMDVNGGTSFTEFGTSQLLSVPYSMHAKTAENTFSGNYSDLSGTPTLPSALSELTNDAGFITESTDADADPTNEIQDISLAGAELSISDGSTVDLSGLGTGGSETDPEVGSNTLNFLSKWDGSALVTSSIFDNGDIGIGTETPSAKLDIAGNLKLNGSNQFGTALIAESTLPHTGAHESVLMILNASDDPASEANIQLASGSPAHGRATISATHDVAAGLYNGILDLEIRNGTTSYIKALTIRSSGNVGIGNTDPLTKLDVGGVVTATGGNSDQWNEAFSWGNHADAGYITSAGAETDPEVGVNTLNFVPRWDGSALVTSNIFDNGKIGIGNSDPTEILHITSTSTPNIRVDAPGDNGFYIGFNAAGYMAFSTVHSGASYLDAMILKEGKLGIGTITPNATLDIAGNLNMNGSNQFGTALIAESTLPHTGPHESVLMILNASDDPASEANIQLASGSPAHSRATISATHDAAAGLYNGILDLEIRNGNTSYIKALTIRSSGNVGIGLASPDHLLSVAGMIQSTVDGYKFPDGTVQITAGTGDPLDEIQDLQLNTNVLAITNNAAPTDIDLTPYLDNTDEQDLELTDNTLSLTNDATTVDLSGYLDNTDEQNLTDVLNQGADAGGLIIENLADPVNNQDAATKAYIDQLILKLGDTDKLLNAGYTLEQMIQSGTPIASLREDGIPDVDIINAGADPLNMFVGGIGVGTMEQNGVSALDLESAGLIGTLQDYELNEYKWVRIGNQIWMAENLKSTTYPDGTPISEVYVYDGDENNADTYGRLYTWNAIMNGEESSNSYPSGVQGVCPIGWHVPSKFEWNNMELHLGMSPEDVELVVTWRGTNEADMLKETGPSHWTTNNGTNETGFTAIGAGMYNVGSYVALDLQGVFQTATESSTTHSFNPFIDRNEHGIFIHNEIQKSSGSSIRCIKDNYPVNLVLWNKLDSDYQVENSVFGGDGQIVGTDYTFEDAEHGKGYVRTAIGSNYVNFPQTILQNLREKGTVELWINPKEPNPVAFSYGVYALVGNIFGTGSHVYVAWGDGTSGNGIYGSVNFDGTGIQTPFESTQFVATVGTPFHIAISWDVNGIDGSANTVRVYRDGAIIGSNDTTWDHLSTAVNYDGFNLGLSPDGEGYDKFIVDNLKVWNIAKTDFSDRFEE